ncbi:MAG TPA: AraC family transcriptional regulator [Kofleriaceae bacterium]|nr:AraC family transcriptional regulator [Kofleriaceae bacterium]
MAHGATLTRLLRARDLLHADSERGPTLDELAGAAGLSRAHLARQFAQTFGVPPHQYLVQLRLDRAKRALASGESVTDVCYQVGFESLGTFSASFRRRTGMSPREWQRAARPFVQSRGVPVLYIPGCFLIHAEHV